jgi:hypothetical protein
MARHKMINGICRLCGHKTKLSFEHVPPKTTNNKNTRYTSLSLEEYFKSENPLESKQKGKIKQGGIGYNSFCRKCNSFLGTNYVNAYKKWVNAGYQVISKYEIYRIKYQVCEIEPLKILKHIISMFLAINEDYYLESFPELSKFILNVNSKTLPDKYRVFTYLNKDGNTRYLPHMIVGDFTAGKPISCSEIAYPPYGYVITFDNPDKIQYLTDITGFKNFEINKKYTLNFNMFQLPTHLSIPLDYRVKDKIKIGKEFKKN